MGVRLEEGSTLDDDDLFLEVLLVDLHSTQTDFFMLNNFDSNNYRFTKLREFSIPFLVVVPDDSEE